MLEKSFVEEKKVHGRTLDKIIKEKNYKELSKHLEQGISDYLEGDTFKRYLNFVSQFHKYSQRNIRLILEQQPEATRVAGFQAWKKLDRTVKKGSKALYVYAPRRQDKKDKDGNVITNAEGEIQTELSFFLTPVFDVSQTAGEKELPKQLYNILDNFEEPKIFTRTYQTLEDMSPVPITIEPISGQANGYYSPTDKRIVIKQGLGEIMTLKVVIHEMAHALLHSNSEARFGDNDYRRQEFEAESVAYIVTSHLGLDTSEYSFGYLASWTDRGNKLETLTESLETITSQAKAMIEHIDQQLDRVTQLSSPKNKFEERVADARAYVSPPPRVPKKEVDVSNPKKKTTHQESVSHRFNSSKQLTKQTNGGAHS